MNFSTEIMNNINFAVDDYVNQKGSYKNIKSTDEVLTQIIHQVFGEDDEKNLKKLNEALTSSKDFGFFASRSNKKN